MAQIGPETADREDVVRPWKIYSAASAVAVGAFVFIPQTGWLPTVWQVGVGWIATAAVIVGVRLHRPPAAVSWYLFAAGIFLNSSGIGVEAVLTARGWTLDTPSPPDAFYLSLYPALIGGLIVLVLRRSTQREWSSLIDAMIISTGLGLLVWVSVIRPALGDPTYSAAGEVVTIAYPVGDLVVLTLVLRLTIGSGTRSAAYRLLAGSVSLFLLGDGTWAVINQFGLNPGTRTVAAISALFLLAYASLGAAALHPSVGTIATPAARRASLGLVMISVLATVALIAPTLLMVEAASHRVTDGVAIGVGSMALFLLVIVRMGLLYRQVESQARTLRRLSEVDELTQLPNRRALGTVLHRALERSRRDGSPVALAVFDLDHFKRFNDERGHPAGDGLLQQASAAWSAQLRTIDVVSRYGGEEFVLVLPDTTLDAAAEVIDRLQAATPGDQTFSAGLALWDGLETGDELIGRADVALYAAKRAGRNRTVVSASAEPVPQSPEPRSGRSGGPPLTGHRRPAGRVDDRV